MFNQHLEDPYSLRPESIEAPPNTYGGVFRRIGPGLITAAAVVGTGELIATTVLGAEMGYSLLWLVILSCAVKAVIQNELGRYAIATGETGLEAMNRVPGPRFLVGWVVWLWFLMQVSSLTTLSAMFAGVAEVLNMIVPGLSIGTWVWVIMTVTMVVLMFGRYRLIETVAVVLVVTFTLTTVSAALLMSRTPEYFSWSSVLDGLKFHFPEGSLLTAVAVFGLTGVGSADLIQYPYWCIEKGYARFTGPRENEAAWLDRARGWTRVMGADVLTSMCVYTFATVAFYLLGAGVLHTLGVVPKGAETIKILSNMYTQVLGNWSRYFFLAGAVAVLYSTLFAGAAATARVFADYVRLIGVYERDNFRARFLAIRIFSAIVLLIPVVFYMFLPQPVLLVQIGGVGQALMLPIIGFATLYLRYTHLPKPIAPKTFITLILWIVSSITLVLMGYSVLRRLGLA